MSKTFSSHKLTVRTTRGLTLVEIMVAVAVSLILFLGIAQIFVANKRAYRVQDDNSHMQENGRFATGMLAQDLRRAGYYGGNSNIKDITGSQPLVAATNTCPVDTTWARMLLWPVAGTNGNNTNYTCIPAADYTPGTDILVTRYTKGADLSGTALLANKMYLRSSLFEGRLFFGSEEALASNVVTETPNMTQELVANAYYVGPTGRTCPDNSPIVALFRESLNANAVPVKEEIASNVENLQVQFGIDTDEDLNTDQFLDADNITDWTQVSAVRYWILVRSRCPQPGNYVNTRTYTMGDVSITPNDAYKRQLYTGTVSLRNQ